MLISRYLIYNKKRTFIMVLSVTLATTLLLGISLLFSSVHSYMVNVSLKEKPYHVSFKSENFERPSYVKTKKYQDGIIYLKYKNVFDTYKNTKNICTKIKCENIIYNENVLSLYGISKNENIMDTFKTLLITILFILGIAILILISNAFRITLIERKREIGILKSIGMEKLKIIKMILGEGTVVLIIGLMFGIMMSMWLVQLLIVSINYLLSGIFEVRLILSIYPLFVIISLIFIILIFYIACLMPAFKISKVSIISSLRGNDDFIQRKVPFYVSKFKVIKKLAFFNYYRLKKKYRPVKLCVLVSSILYISFSLYLNYGIGSIDKYVKIPNYDYFINTAGSDENYKKLNDFGKNYKKHKLYKACNLKGVILNESYLDRNDYLEKRNVIAISNKNEGILNFIKEDNDNKITNNNKKYLKDKVILKINESNEFKTIDKIPFGIDSLITKDNTILFTSSFDKYCPSYDLNLYIKDNSKNITNDLNKLKIETEISYVDVKKASKLTKNFVLAIKISLYGVLVLVIVIGILLILSTFSVNFNLRMKEIGILKSVGFTNFGLKRLLFIECLICLFKIFVWIIIFSYLISYVLYKSISTLMVIDMIIPINEIVISFLVSLFIICFTLNSNYKKINRKGIIKMISNNNI